MYNLTRLCYGVNPGGKFTGEGAEDEGVWALLIGEQIMSKGKVVESSLAQLDRKLGKD